MFRTSQVICTVVMLVYAAAANAAVVASGSGFVDGKEVSATASFELIDNALIITLTNTGAGSDYTSAQVLTDISFNLTGEAVVFDVAESSVVVAAGSTLLGSAAGTIDVSSEWGLATDMPLMNDGTSVQRMFTVTSASLGNANDNLFAAVDLGGGAKLGGTDFGLINELSQDNSGLASGGKNRVVDTVVITLVIQSGSVTLDSLGDIIFSFGSSHDTIEGLFEEIPSVPTPAAMPAGLALLALAAMRRRRAV